MKVREALWSAVACYRFCSTGTSDLAVGHYTVAWETTPRASSRDQSGSKLPHSRAPLARKSAILQDSLLGFAGFALEKPRSPQRSQIKGLASVPSTCLLARARLSFGQGRAYLLAIGRGVLFALC